MRAQIVRIGNSRGIRIPKALLDHLGLKDRVVLEPGAGKLVVRPVRSPRDGWDKAFQEMAHHRDDRLLDGGRWPKSKWDREEWEW